LKPVLKIVLLLLIGVVLVSTIFGLLGAVLGTTFGIAVDIISFIWRVLLRPAALVVLIVWIVSLVRKKRSAG